MTLVVAARCLMFRTSSERELLAVAGPEPDSVASDAGQPKALVLGPLCRFSGKAVDAGDGVRPTAGFEHEVEEPVKFWFLPSDRQAVRESEVCRPYIDSVNTRGVHDFVEVPHRFPGFYLDKTKDLGVHMLGVPTEDHLGANRTETSVPQRRVPHGGSRSLGVSPVIY